jgi:hypothetical protein
LSCVWSAAVRVLLMGFYVGCQVGKEWGMGVHAPASI